MVPAGARVADVGTDHAQLLAWLCAHGGAAGGVGIDVNPGPLAQARRTLVDASVRGVELRLGDGLGPLVPGEVDVVVLAGMGGARVVRLLDARPDVVAALQRLVLQPNTEPAAVRRWVMERGHALEGEAMVEDRGKHYVVLDVRPGAPQRATRAWTDEELELGPRLLAERPPAFVAWLRHELARCERAAERCRLGRGSSERRAALHDRASRLRRVLGEVL